MHGNQLIIGVLDEMNGHLLRCVNGLVDIKPTDNDIARAHIEQARMHLDLAIKATVTPGNELHR